MKRPHLSTGAWIFASVVAAAAIVAPTAYAAVSSTVAIGNTGSSTTTATVTASHQLLTTTIPPKDVVMASGSSTNTCNTVYTPPAGKAIVVSTVTYDMFGNTAGSDNIAVLSTASCSGEYDVAETTQASETETRTFPLGLPMPSVTITSELGKGVEVHITGFLIPASQLPATAPAAKLPARLAHPPK